MRRFITSVTLAAVWAFTTAAPNAGAAITVFSDDFSGDTPVSGATDVSHPALQGGDIGKLWRARTTSISSGDPTVDPTKLWAVQVRSDDPAGGPANNHVKLTRAADASMWGYAHAQLTDAAQAMTVGNTNVTVSFRLFIPEGASSTSEFRVLGNPLNTIGDAPGNTGTAAFTNNAFSIRFQNPASPAGNTKNVGFVGGAAVSGSGTATYTLGMWNDVLIEANYLTRRLQLTVTNANGTTSTQRDFPADADGMPALDRLGTVQFTIPGNGTIAYFDDVQITVVPEPVSLATVGLGGLALAARHPRRRGGSPISRAG